MIIKNILSSLVFGTILALGLMLFTFQQPSTTKAFDGSKCTYIGQCVDNVKCYSPCGNSCGVWVPGGACGSAVIGGIQPPDGVLDYNQAAAIQGGGGNAIGIFVFLSTALKLFTVVAGLFMFFNFFIAGYTLIAGAGNSQKYTDVRERLTFGIIGLVIIVAAYMIAAMIGLLFFGDATFILQPDISQYGAI